MRSVPGRAPARPEGPGWVVRGGRVVVPVLVPELPKEVPFGFLTGLVPATGHVELDLELYPIPTPRALEMLEGAEAIAESELVRGGGAEGARHSELEAESESARDLGRRVAVREQELWRVGAVFRAVGRSRASAELSARELERRLKALGFRTRRPLFQASEASEPPSLLALEARPTGYWHTLHTDGVAAFFPFVDEVVAEPGGVLVGLLLEDASPVLVDRWSHSSYSWGVFGATGSGKSFAAALLAMRTRWMDPSVRLFVLDPLGEFAGFARALGGCVVDPSRPTEGRWNPLDPATTGGDRLEKAARLGPVLRSLFPTLHDEESSALDRALVRLYDAGGEPTFSRLLDEVGRVPGGAGRLPGLLEVFVRGSLRHLDGPSTAPPSAPVVDFDLHGVAEPHRPFLLAALLDRIYGEIRAAPGRKLLVVDEAHLLARVPETAEYLDRLVRHVRHFEAGVVVLSQNPDDFLGTEGGRSLLRNLRAALLLRLPEVSEATRRFFALTEAEADWIPRARLPREAGYSEGLLRLGPSHLPLAVVASTPEYEFLVRALAPPAAPGATRA